MDSAPWSTDSLIQITSKKSQVWVESKTRRVTSSGTQTEADVAVEALSENPVTAGSRRPPSRPNGTRSRGTNHGYLTFIAVPIVVGDRGYGMLTLDASHAESFTDTNLKACGFVAGLLGIAFACAQTSKAPWPAHGASSAERPFAPRLGPAGTRP